MPLTRLRGEYLDIFASILRLPCTGLLPSSDAPRAAEAVLMQCEQTGTRYAARSRMRLTEGHEVLTCESRHSAGRPK